MTPGSNKSQTVEKVTKYIQKRVAGVNKQESALQAGYATPTARNPSLIEHTKTYQSIVEKVLTNSANLMLDLTDSLREDMRSGVLEELKPLEKAQIYKIITDSADKLTPKITLKEMTDKNGNVTRTAWAQNASQVQEVMTNEQESVG